ncbi:sulfurtransferase [Leptospira idonii]|uniref:sulfurtransferase n=1 Tax=Leptospira idonii TaxID=1193500 RepID=UPI0014385825|nr:rhodanese-like domain-containing protein [Leptospira idonii]
MRKITYLTLLLSIAALGTSSCKKTKEYDFIMEALKFKLPILLKVNTAEELASESADNYADNRYGLITASTLERWVNNWDTEKPEGISRKLVILQIQTGGTASGRYVPQNTQKGVYTFLVTDATTSFAQTRNNGLIDTETMVAKGASIDALLYKYGIDLSKDLVVFAQDSYTTGDYSNLWFTLRGWFAFRYWGADKKHLAVLNGAVSNLALQGQLFTTLRGSTEYPEGGSSLRNLFTDNTILHATIGDVLHIVRNGNTGFTGVTPIPAGGVFILDARRTDEYGGVQDTTAGASGRSCTTTPCVSPIEGNIKGSVNLPFANLLDAATGSFLTKAELANTFSGIGYTKGKTVVTYCRTNVRSMVTGFAAISILGYPTRYYDGSWIEWSAFASYNDSTNTGNWSNLAASSPWRTNSSAVTNNLTANTDAKISKFSFTITQQYSTSSNQIITEDKAYLISTGGSSASGGGGSSSGSSGGGGGGGGANACGG